MTTWPKLLLFLTVLLLTRTVAAAGIDLHRMWDDRCSRCHGHAGAFARQYLRVVDGKLQGRHADRDLHRFLHNHYLAGGEVDAVYDMLLAQARSQARFKQQCSQCHGNAADFVRTKLELRNGVLYSRPLGHEVRSFLTHHRGLKPDQVEFFTDTLTRIAHEIYRR